LSELGLSVLVDLQDLPHQGLFICVYTLFWNWIGWEKSW